MAFCRRYVRSSAVAPATAKLTPLLKSAVQVVDDEEAVRAAAGGLLVGLAVGEAADGGEEANGSFSEQVAGVSNGVAEAVDGVDGAGRRGGVHESLQ